ncbi:helix-turn-helix domain-containing protein [Streptomyces sp. N50]|uniref:helix-turn-helix domain-containing protein n=1 Tax=Streptomyces sp. N50 TaxID=3081765 RepID=UPI00296222DD|nr:helix-turn-helix domain-containing protein [Streptomyces sp. N50]WOX14232.1 helix-turn-helix domain-containing protein [Streptomyces sp. N50]
MTTLDHSPALAPLRRARERFLSGRPLPDDVPDEVLAAWRRARFFGVRHDLDGPVHEPELPADSALLEAARPALDRIAPALGHSAMLLTDERLRVLWTTGEVPGDDRCRDLSEREVGHNSAALALRTRRRAEVHGPEHFLDVWQDVSAVSVPLLAPDSGQVLGTVTVASALCAGCGPHPGAALAEATATAVEAELLARSRTAERVLLDAYTRATTHGPARAIVALDGRNRLISEAAVRLATPQVLAALERSSTSERASGARPAQDSRMPQASGGGSVVERSNDAGGGPAVERSNDAGGGPAVERSNDAEGGRSRERQADTGCGSALERSNPAGRRPVPEQSYGVTLPADAGCTAEITPVRHEGRILGIVAVLEARAAEVPVPRLVPRPALALAGGSVPWRHAVARAVELARVHEPLLLTGERGSGKTALARELLGGTVPLVADAAESPELGVKYSELADGRPLLLRHAERLAQPDVAALNSLLDEHPDVYLLVTYTPGTPPGPCFQRLLDTLAARSVTVPALRERPEDVRELLPVLAPRPAPGQPPLTWTLDALRALEEHPWPGNVTELAHVVRALAEHRRVTGPVRRAELPDPVREGPAARRLSPMEHAERTAILAALRRHGGNKARAAAALGIGRATLYRKLRGYRDLP